MKLLYPILRIDNNLKTNGVDNSIKIAKSILHAAADVLGNDTDIDIDNLIDDAFIEVVTEWEVIRHDRTNLLWH